LFPITGIHQQLTYLLIQRKTQLKRCIIAFKKALKLYLNLLGGKHSFEDNLDVGKYIILALII
jgi:hypothetical protein